MYTAHMPLLHGHSAKNEVMNECQGVALAVEFVRDENIAKTHNLCKSVNPFSAGV
jgi:hypothetical protein